MRSKSTSRDKKVRLQCLAFEDRVVPANVFNPMSPYIISGLNTNNSSCVAVADFNHDGNMDAVLPNFGTDFGANAGTQMIVLYGNGTGNGSGGFSRVTTPTGGSNVSFATVADLNNDGWADVIVTNENGHNTGSVSVFQNDTNGNLVPVAGSPFSSFGFDPVWVGAADVTGDNIPDIVVCNFGKDDGSGTNVIGSNMVIFQGLGNFTYSASPITTFAPGPQFIPTSAAIADLDNDGLKDIAVTVPSVPPDQGLPQQPGTVYLFKGTGSGGFAAPSTIDTGTATLPINIQAADLNNDGRKDLVIACAGDPTASPEFVNNSVAVSLNFSSGGNVVFGLTNDISANCHGTFAVAVADFDLDGKQDIAAVNYGGYLNPSPQAFVSLYTGNGTGGFTAGNPGTYNTNTNLPGGQYLAVGDFNNDGKPDLIVAHASSYVGVLKNIAVGAAAPHVTSTQVNDGNAQRSLVTSLRVSFDTQVTFSGNDTTGAFTLTRNGGGAVSFQASASVVGGVTVVTLSNFTGSETDGFGSLNDGRFTLTALASHITANGQPLGGGTGTNYTFTDAQGLFRMFGDYNGDANVNGLDFGFFKNAFGTSSGDSNYLAFFDFNGDGAINGFDFGQFKLRSAPRCRSRKGPSSKLERGNTPRLRFGLGLFHFHVITDKMFEKSSVHSGVSPGTSSSDQAVSVTVRPS